MGRWAQDSLRGSRPPRLDYRDRRKTPLTGWRRRPYPLYPLSGCQVSGVLVGAVAITPSKPGQSGQRAAAGCSSAACLRCGNRELKAGRSWPVGYAPGVAIGLLPHAIEGHQLLTTLFDGRRDRSRQSPGKVSGRLAEVRRLPSSCGEGRTRATVEIFPWVNGMNWRGAITAMSVIQVRWRGGDTEKYLAGDH